MPEYHGKRVYSYGSVGAKKSCDTWDESF